MIKHDEISIKFVDALIQMQSGEITLEKMINLINDTEAAYPGDEEQRRFYKGMRNMALKVADAIENWPDTEESKSDN